MNSDLPSVAILPTIRGQEFLDNVEKISVALTPEMASAMRHVVETGEYAPASEVVRDALRGWAQRRAERAKAIEDLGRAWDTGVQSGTTTDGETAFERMRENVDSRLNGSAAE